MKQLLRITILLLGLIWILAWAAAGRFDDTPNTQDGSESPLPSGEITAPGERDSAKTLRVQIQGEVQEMDMGTYLLGVLRAEMPASFEEEALKAQAILARTFVLKFVETKDYILVRHTQDTILASYLNDMSKYNNLNEIKKTRLAYDNITVQLSKKNTRFQYKLIKKGGRASEFENAIEWLCLSGIVSQVYKVEQIKKPLENYRDIDAFKIYVSDLGLLCAKKDLAANDILYMVEEINDFKGGMAENYVNVQLSINGYHTYYWESERGAEIDFIIQRDGQLIPIEVKSADNTRAKSLKVYMDTYKPAYAIKLSAKNFGFEDNKKTVPLYAAFCI